MTIAGLALPELSAYHPPASSEGGLDPMGLAAISDRLAERLAPGVRARMQRIRFVTAMAVGATANETLTYETPKDEVSTPAICFEWLAIEGFVRRLAQQEIPQGVPGSQKARAVIKRGQRLSAATYLKGPAVFGFNGVYKPFAMDARIVNNEVEPGYRCADLTRAWEIDQGFVGFTDNVPGTEGARLRVQVRDQVRDALRQGRCTTNPSSWIFGLLAKSLHPERAAAHERHVLRSLVTSAEHEFRSELATLLVDIEDELTEAQALSAVRPRCSADLKRIVDAVNAYEQFAARVDATFRTLCSVSYSLGSQPITASTIASNELIARCARELPDRFKQAAEKMAAIGAESGLEQRLGEFTIPRSTAELFELLLEHHEAIQSAKLPNGKRPWFESVRNGWVVRRPYGTPNQPELGPWFVHPVRVAALRRFLRDTTT